MAHDMLTAKRATRGLRMSSLVGKAAEEDDAFWKHETWAEEGSEDDSFSEEEVQPDVFDSDFNDSEDDDDNEDSDDDDKPRRRDKEQSTTNRYKEPAKVKKVVQPNNNDDNDNNTNVPRKKKQRTQFVFYEDMKREVRDSTKKKTTSTELELQERSKIKHVSRPIIRHKFTQKELLLDALETEDDNRKWLEHRKIVEDEKSARDKPIKNQNNDHYIRFLSRRGTYDTITFTNVDSIPAFLKQQITPVVPKNICVITGLPAKYKDPLTGLPYNNIAAFKELRKKYISKQSSSPRRILEK